METEKYCWSLIFINLIFLSDVVYVAASKEDEKNQENSGFLSSDNVAFGLKTAAVAGAAIVGAPLVLSAAGFTGAGVAAGSFAAYYQSAMLGGTIASSSLFAGLQSLGAAGLGVGAKATLAAVSGVGVKIYEKWTGNDDGDSGGCPKARETKQECFEKIKN